MRRRTRKGREISLLRARAAAWSEHVHTPVCSYDRAGGLVMRDKEAKDPKGRDDALEVAAGEASQVLVLFCEADVLDGEDHHRDLPCDEERIPSDAHHGCFPSGSKSRGASASALTNWTYARAEVPPVAFLHALHRVRT